MPDADAPLGRHRADAPAPDAAPAVPATDESGSFVLATEASTAASYWIGPSTSSRGSLPRTSSVASRTLSTSAPEPEEPVE